ncbi:MAG TPA: MFS transporter [Actinomycetota bacterium]|nr:MFS transporter [Actinomycetota bacterium]
MSGGVHRGAARVPGGHRAGVAQWRGASGAPGGRGALTGPIADPPETRRTPRAARISIALAFAIHAAAAGTLGPRIPALKARSALSDGDLGIALTAFAAGLFAGARLAAPLLRRAGSRRVIRLGTPVLCAALAFTGAVRGLVALAAALALFGALSGLLDVANNAQAVAVERSYGRPIISGIHATWSAGLLVSGAVGAILAALDVPLPVNVATMATLLAAVSFPALRALLPTEPRDSSGEGGPPPRRMIPILGAVAFASFMVEGAAVDWSAVHLRDSLGASAGVAGVGFAAFAGGMTVSRLVADRAVRLLGPTKVVRTAGVVGGAGFAAAALAGATGMAVVAFALVGVAMAPVVPEVFSAAGNAPRGHVVLGWVATMGYVGAVLGPAVIGAVAEWTSLRTALLVPAGAALLVALLGRIRSPARPAAPAPHAAV